MTENKLLSIIITLTGPEKRECTQFLKSPYFNQREDVLRCWDYFLSRKGRETHPGEAFEYANPGVPFNDQAWRHLQTFLQLRIENFLALRATEQSPLLSDLHLASVFREKGLLKHSSQLFRRAEANLDGMPRDNDYFYNLYRLEWEKYASFETQTRSRVNNLGAVNHAFDVYLIGTKLRLACLLESHRAVFNIGYDNTVLQSLLPTLASQRDLFVPVVALYYHCYQALTGGQENEFRAFRAELENQNAGLPADERRIFLLIAVNYCIKQLNSGESHYIREAFDLYKLGLDTNLLLENEVLSRFAYKNIVALGLRLQEYTWVESFIYRHEPYLEARYRAANRDYNLARLFYAQKDYKSAMPLLARVDEADLLLNLDSRIMLLKMYYETGEWDALDALLSSFRILLLRKKKAIGYHQTYYLNTLRYISKMARLNFMDKKALAALRTEVESGQYIIEKEWLLSALSQ
jgi:hypothetical protein